MKKLLLIILALFGVTLVAGAFIGNIYMTSLKCVLNSVMAGDVCKATISLELSAQTVALFWTPVALGLLFALTGLFLLMRSIRQSRSANRADVQNATAPDPDARTTA